MAIHSKLLAFQKKGISVKRDGSNPHFRSSYTTLNEVLDKVLEPLNEAGIVVVQRPTVFEGTSGLWTELIDTEDDSRVESFVPFVNTADMQKLGGAITYSRRYALISMLALSDDDDDGNTASAKPKGVGDMDKAPDFSI